MYEPTKQVHPHPFPPKHARRELGKVLAPEAMIVPHHHSSLPRSLLHLARVPHQSLRSLEDDEAVHEGRASLHAGS